MPHPQHSLHPSQQARHQHAHQSTYPHQQQFGMPPPLAQMPTRQQPGYHQQKSGIHLQNPHAHGVPSIPPPAAPPPPPTMPAMPSIPPSAVAPHTVMLNVPPPAMPQQASSVHQMQHIVSSSPHQVSSMSPNLQFSHPMAQPIAAYQATTPQPPPGALSSTRVATHSVHQHNHHLQNHHNATQPVTTSSPMSLHHHGQHAYHHRPHIQPRHPHQSSFHQPPPPTMQQALPIPASQQNHTHRHQVQQQQHYFVTSSVGAAMGTLTQPSYSVNSITSNGQSLMHHQPMPHQQNLVITSPVTMKAHEQVQAKSSKEKTPMCLINELARFNKTDHHYRLTDESGPAHKKTFTVCLRLGENEDYVASGPSIKKAQHAAAAIALEKTKLKHPPPKVKAAKPVNVTPTVELNALAMKRGEPTSYTFMNSGAAVGCQDAINGMKNGHFQMSPHIQTLPSQPNPNFRGNQNQRCQNFSGKSQKALQYQVSLRVGSREFFGEGPTPQAAKHAAASKALKVLKEQHSPSLSPSSGSKSVSLNPASIPFVPGGGPNQPAATQAASKASAISSTNALADDHNSCQNLDDLKSPISLVHEDALKRNLTVTFTVTRESGPPHMRTFVTKCVVGDFVTVGEGNGKKVSKKNAAELMLEKLRTLPPVASCQQPKAKAKKAPVPKKKSKKLIKVEPKANADFGQNINPISRLIQIQQAKHEKEPVYTLIAENGAPRRREFVMQVCVGNHVATGSGPNKKFAKRSAAENLLQMMGYTRPQPLPGKPVLKSNNNEATTSAGNAVNKKGDQQKPRKLTFVDETNENVAESSSRKKSSSGPLEVSIATVPDSDDERELVEAESDDQIYREDAPGRDKNLSNGTDAGPTNPPVNNENSDGATNGEPEVFRKKKDFSKKKSKQKVRSDETNGHATPIVSASGDSTVENGGQDHVRASNLKNKKHKNKNPQFGELQCKTQEVNKNGCHENIGLNTTVGSLEVLHS